MQKEIEKKKAELRRKIYLFFRELAYSGSAIACMVVSVRLLSGEQPTGAAGFMIAASLFALVGELIRSTGK